MSMQAVAPVVAPELASTISEVGYAKVIVALKPQIAAATAAAAEMSLSTYFRAPQQAEAQSLALVATHFASKSFARKTPIPKRAVRVYPRLGLAMGYVDRQGVSGLAADNRVESLVAAPELSLIKPVEVKAARPQKNATWGIERLGAPKLWNAGITGDGVVVAHLDTGVDGNHPVLRGAIAAFAEFDMAGDQVPNAKPWDSGMHGTHTAGTIVGRTDSRGPIGVAPGARLASALVIEGGQVIDRILGGLEWALGQNAKVLSMSLGLRGYTPAFQVIINALRTQNVLPVIAVGNDGPLTSRSPGNYPNVLSIGAFGPDDRVADFSSSQRFDRQDDPFVPDLVGPGVGVLSCTPNNSYAIMDGTSMATPHIAGLAALLLQGKPAATVDELENAILSSCRRPPTMPEDRANRGVPDAVTAFEKLTGHPLPQPAVFQAVSARRVKRTKRAKGRTAARRPAPGRSAKRSKRKAKTRRRGRR